MTAKHLASFALMSVNRPTHRIGTRMIYRFEQISDAMKEPYFMFRNDECHADYLDWLMHNGHEESDQ